MRSTPGMNTLANFARQWLEVRFEHAALRLHGNNYTTNPSRPIADNICFTLISVTHIQYTMARFMTFTGRRIADHPF